MIPVLTPSEMKAADQRAIALGTAETILVERAGAAVARHAVRMLGGTYGRRVVVVCGKGNNGADGLVAARQTNTLAIIDFWATWCKNCVVMDRTTLADPAVTKALEGYVKIKYQAEQLDEQPARTVVERVKAVGLPTYAILRPQVTFSPQPNASAK